MLCEKCRKNEANVHVIKNINGQASEMHLCESCARESGELLSANQLLGSFFESVLPLRPRRAAYMPAGVPAVSRYAGCEDCAEDPPAQAAGAAEVSAKDARAGKLAELKEQMEEAVEKEKFEQAARLRDEIKKLEDGQEE